MGSRARFGLAGLVLCFAIAVFGLGVGAARGEDGTVISGDRTCIPGRALCITVSTFTPVTASQTTPDGTRYTYATWTVENIGGSTLTQVRVDAVLSESTAAWATPLPAGCTGSGTSISCRYANLNAHSTFVSPRMYFKTANAPAASNDITATAFAKEGGNDSHACPAGGTDPNCDTATAKVTNTYEIDAKAAFTFALNGKRFGLPSNDGLSSFTFTSASAANFFTSFKVLDPSTNFCFDVENVACFDRTLFASTENAPGFSATNPVVFYARLLDPPAGVTKKSLDAIHFYDPIALTSAGNRLTPGGTPSFARMDGLNVDAAAGATLGIAAGKYFVVGYQASDNSFRLSLTKGGAPIPLAAGSVQAAGIRIIGDQADERSTSSSACSTNPPPTPIPFNIPVICVQDLKVGKTQALDSWVWDLGNGFIQH